MLRGGGHRGEGAEAQAVRPRGDGIVRVAQRGDVDNALRPQHVQFHQVDQRRAAGQKLNRRVRLTLSGVKAQARGLRQVVGALVGKWTHQGRSICSRACLMAATMFG